MGIRESTTGALRTVHIFLGVVFGVPATVAWFGQSKAYQAIFRNFPLRDGGMISFCSIFLVINKWDLVSGVFSTDRVTSEHL